MKRLAALMAAASAVAIPVVVTTAPMVRMRSWPLTVTVPVSFVAQVLATVIVSI